MPTAPRFIQGEGRRVRIDHVLNDRTVYHPGRHAEVGIQAPFAVLYLGGLVRDLAEGLEGYRYGTDFRLFHDYDRASIVAGQFVRQRAIYASNGRGAHLGADLGFWRANLPEGLPRFFPSLIVGVAGELAVGQASELPFAQLDEFSARFVRDHFRPPPATVATSALL